MGQAQRVLVNGIASGWQPVTSAVLQGSFSKAVLFNICTNYVDICLEVTLSKFVDDAKLREAAPLHFLGGRETLHRDLDKLEGSHQLHEISEVLDSALGLR